MLFWIQTGLKNTSINCKIEDMIRGITKSDSYVVVIERYRSSYFYERFSESYHLIIAKNKHIAIQGKIFLYALIKFVDAFSQVSSYDTL